MERHEPVTREHLQEQGLSIIEVPPQWREDPLIRDRLFFTLPQELLQWLTLQINEQHFEPTALQREYELTKAVREDHGFVGFRNSIPLKYPYLFPSQPVRLDEYARRSLGITVEISKHLEKLGTNRLNSFDGPLRGFIGWLMTEPDFLKEHDELVSQHWEMLRAHGFPQPMVITPDGDTQELTESPLDSEWVSDFREFYERWRLQTLAAPGLPVPLATRVPDAVGRSHTGLPEGIQSLYVPDIVPLPGKGTVVETLEDALRGSPPPEHLKGWMDIVDRKNVARNQIQVFERRFQLQHYWRVLQIRHRDALTRRKKVLTGVFAEFLGTSEDTIKGDLRFLEDRLGKDWDKRPFEYDATP